MIIDFIRSSIGQEALVPICYWCIERNLGDYGRVDDTTIKSKSKPKIC